MIRHFVRKCALMIVFYPVVSGGLIISYMRFLPEWFMRSVFLLTLRVILANIEHELQWAVIVRKYADRTDKKHDNCSSVYRKYCKIYRGIESREISICDPAISDYF